MGSFPGGIHRRERMADQSSAIFRTLNTCGFVPPICSSFIKSKWALATADATGLGTPMPRLRLDFAEWMHAFSPHWFPPRAKSLFCPTAKTLFFVPSQSAYGHCLFLSPTTDHEINRRPHRSFISPNRNTPRQIPMNVAEHGPLFRLIMRKDAPLFSFVHLCPIFCIYTWLPNT